MKENIGSVSLNLEFYTGQNIYSDGNIEELMLDIAKENKIEEYIENNNELQWPILYHFSKERENILEWYEFEKEKNLLEVGCGCGALTGMLCNKLKKVTAVEASKRRAEITAYRNIDKTNLDIIVGNFNDIRFNEKYDYITLIGVLEYAEMFIDSRAPFRDFLLKLKELLKENGILLIAIENKYGLKYWSGHVEDHVNLYYEGIEGYTKSYGAKTFSKKELISLIKDAGYDKYRFYYPMPDYKFANTIYSDEYMPKFGDIASHFPNYSNEKLNLFNEKLVINNLIKDGLFEEFSNSFLVEIVK